MPCTKNQRPPTSRSAFTSFSVYAAIKSVAEIVGACCLAFSLSATACVFRSLSERIAESMGYATMPASSSIMAAVTTQACPEDRPLFARCFCFGTGGRGIASKSNSGNDILWLPEYHLNRLFEPARIIKTARRSSTSAIFWRRKFRSGVGRRRSSRYWRNPRGDPNYPRADNPESQIRNQTAQAQRQGE
jgi:hypothetical protein